MRPFFGAVITALVLCVGGPSAFAQEAVPPPTAPAEEAPGLGKLFREVPRDLWRFFSVDTAVVLGAGGGAALISHMSDDDIVAAFQGGDPNLSVTRIGNAYGAFATQVGLGFTLYGVGRGSGHPHLAIAGADVVRAQIVSQLWTQAIKHTVRRERPDGTENVSFPSGHSASGFSTATVLLRHYGWKAGAPAYALAGVGAAARIRSNKHYLSDVVFGAAMGIAGARTVLHAGRYGMRVAPSLTPGGGAIMFLLAPR